MPRVPPSTFRPLQHRTGRILLQPAFPASPPSTRSRLASWIGLTAPATSPTGKAASSVADVSVGNTSSRARQGTLCCRQSENAEDRQGRARVRVPGAPSAAGPQPERATARSVHLRGGACRQRGRFGNHRGPADSTWRQRPPSPGPQRDARSLPRGPCLDPQPGSTAGHTGRGSALGRRVPLSKPAGNSGPVPGHCVGSLRLPHPEPPNQEAPFLANQGGHAISAEAASFQAAAVRRP